MSKSYHEIMEKIEVTDEMRSRILANIAAQSEKPLPKVNLHSKWKKIVSFAACIVLLLICGTVIPNRIHSNSTNHGNEVTSPVADIVECSSISELSEKAGFELEELQNIPFEIVSITYSWCWGEIAQIEYCGSENSLVYRKAHGSDDISGDYTEYELVQSDDINDHTVTIKGNDDIFYLATWQSEGYTNSLALSQGVDLKCMQNILALIK